MKMLRLSIMSENVKHICSFRKKRNPDLLDMILNVARGHDRLGDEDPPPGHDLGPVLRNGGQGDADHPPPAAALVRAETFVNSQSHAKHASI